MFQRKLNSPKRKGLFGWPGKTDSKAGKAFHGLFIKIIKKKRSTINVLSIIPVATSLWGEERERGM